MGVVKVICPLSLVIQFARAFRVAALPQAGLEEFDRVCGGGVVPGRLLDSKKDADALEAKLPFVAGGHPISFVEAEDIQPPKKGSA